MTALFSALLADMSDEDLDELTELLAPRLADRFGSPASASAWLTVNAAAEHLACPVSRIYALVSARRIPVHRDGSRLLFDRHELDEWIRAGGGKRP